MIPARVLIALAASLSAALMPASAQTPLAILRPPPPATGPDAALTRDAIEYAAHYRVPPDEARRRLAAQEAGVAATDALAARFADRLAGLYVEHLPAYRIVVLLTGDAPIASETIATGGMAIPVVFQTGAIATRAQLVAVITARQGDIRAAYPLVRGIGADPRTGRLLLMIRAVDAAADDPDRIAAEVTLMTGVPAAVRLLGPVQRDMAAEGGTRAVGGDPDTGRRYVCTTGFVVTDGARTGIATAAHCPDEIVAIDATGIRTPLAFVGQWGARYQDVQINVGDTPVRPAFHADDRIVPRSLTGWRNRSSTRAGDFVCHRGERTGYSCAEIELVDYAPAPPVCAGTCDPLWVTVAGPSCGSGDSGGPVFLGSTAFGLLKGGSYDPDGSCGFYYYMSTDYLPAGWTLLHVR